MTKTVKRVLWVGVAFVVLLVALVAIAPTLISSAAVRKQLVSLAEDHLDAKLEIADLHVSWFGGLRIEGLRLGNPPGFSDGPFVACQEATGGIALWPLLHGVVDLQTVRLEKPDLRLERARDGRWNWEAIVKGGTPAGSGKAPMELPKLKAKIEARDARGELRDDLLGTKTEASGITADVFADLTAAEPRYEFSATVPSVAANQTMGPLLEFVIPFAAVRDSGAELAGTLHIEGHGTVEGRTVDRMLASLETRGRFSIQNGKISGSPLASKLLGLLREPNVFELESMDA
ncbi:MAG: AsmA family protein, partial [Planctomycetes bacterium]|nr:AsmA family protein [Planctomycetota bacterium]